MAKRQNLDFFEVIPWDSSSPFFATHLGGIFLDLELFLFVSNGIGTLNPIRSGGIWILRD